MLSHLKVNEISGATKLETTGMYHTSLVEIVLRDGLASMDFDPRGIGTYNF